MNARHSLVAGIVSLAVATVSLVVAAAPLRAHHSVSATHDKTRVVGITGTVASIDWRNPHVMITLVSRIENGEVLMRPVQIAGPARLTRTGFDPTFLKIGETITIEVWMPKDEPGFRGLGPAGQTLILSDGRRFDVADNWPAPMDGVPPR